MIDLSSLAIIVSLASLALSAVTSTYYKRKQDRLNRLALESADKKAQAGGRIHVGQVVRIHPSNKAYRLTAKVDVEALAKYGLEVEEGDRDGD